MVSVEVPKVGINAWTTAFAPTPAVVFWVTVVSMAPAAPLRKPPEPELRSTGSRVGSADLPLGLVNSE